MSYPPACSSCGIRLGFLWIPYEEVVQKIEKDKITDGEEIGKRKKKFFDDEKLKYCCRRILKQQVNYDDMLIKRYK